MMYIVYLTLNTKNRKIYIGVHQTEDDSVFDYYIGCGVFTNKTIKHPKTPFQFAVKKYGYKAFERITLFRCSSYEEALSIEASIVNEEFLKRSDVYNVTLGGGLPPLLNKSVYQYSLDGTFICEHSSIESASKSVGAAFAGCISSAVSYKSQSFGYLWSLEKFEKLDTTTYNNTLQKVKVYVYDENREFMDEFDSLTETADSLNISKYTTISNCIKSGRQYKNMYFSNVKLNVLPESNILTNQSVIYQYTIEGEYITKYLNRNELKKKLGQSLTGLSTAIANSTPFLDYRWSINYYDKLENLNVTKVTNLGKKIGQFTLDGELIKEYPTVRECRKDFGNVSKVLSGKVSHCKNFTFKYID